MSFFLAVLTTNVDENGEPKDKIFDGGFFKVQSPACTGSPKVRAPKGGSDLLSPSGFNSRPPKKTPSSATPLAVMRATKASRKSLSPRYYGVTFVLFVLSNKKSLLGGN